MSNLINPVNLDNNATTRPLLEVADAVGRALREEWGNPSSVHRVGIAARRIVELARESIAMLVGAQPRELIFTSGGTEGANIALRGSLAHAIASDARRRVLVTSRFEHSAVRETAESLERSGVAEVIWLEGCSFGVPSFDALSALLAARASEVALVSLMWANNETGVVTPIAEYGALCRSHGVRFHSDATQWVGKMHTDLASMQVDLMSFAAHKLHGPKGVGALYVRRGVHLSPMQSGGPQERDRRGGTENVPGIAGFGVAAEFARKWIERGEIDRLAALRDGFERAICEATGARAHGSSGARLWNTSNIAFARLEAEAILLLLSERGVYASAGAACSSGSLDPSPVLLAMGVSPEEAHGSIRFSLSRETSSLELDRAVAVIVDSILKLRRSSSAALA